MASSSDAALTESQAAAFLSPEGPLHRQYEALRAYFVEQLSSAETARRFSYSPVPTLHPPAIRSASWW